MDYFKDHIGVTIIAAFLLLRLIIAPALKRRVVANRDQSRDVLVDPTAMLESDAAAASRAAQAMVDARAQPTGPVQTTTKMKDIDPRGPFL